jgi:hypothetical protein
VSGFCQPAAITDGTAQLNVATIVGMNTLEEEYAFSAWPNPFKEQLHFKVDLPKSGNIMIRISDMHGKTVKEIVQALSAPGSHTFSFSTEYFEPGLYLVNFIWIGQDSAISRTIKIICH